VAQVYIQYPAVERMPLKELKGFKRIHVLKGGKQEVQFHVPVTELEKWDLGQRKWNLYPGVYSIFIGGNSEDVRLKAELNVKTGIK
jgi:beta-glucosidase